MKDGDLLAAMAPAPRRASPDAPTVAAARSATPDPAMQAATSREIRDAAKLARLGRQNDTQSAGSTSASERRAAVVDLMRAHGDAVLGFCVRLLRDHELAEEVRQQTFLDAFRDFDRFQDRSSRRAWLFGIASHRCHDAIRSQQRRSRWIENDEAAVVEMHDPEIGRASCRERV